MPSSLHFPFWYSHHTDDQENTGDIVYPIYLGSTICASEPQFQKSLQKNIKNSQNRAL